LTDDLYSTILNSTTLHTCFSQRIEELKCSTPTGMLDAAFLLLSMVKMETDTLGVCLTMCSTLVAEFFFIM
jgi:hypothetical protein